MITHRTRLMAVLALGAWLLSACNLPLLGGPSSNLPATIDVAQIYTAAAITLQAQQTANALTPVPSETPVPPTNTLAPLPPTSEFSPTPTLTLLPSFTPTPQYPTITASQTTNCRPGPGLDYDPPVGSLKKGASAKVVGRNSNNSWYYIENPTKPGSFCWVWNQTTSVDGPTLSLPVLTPPPLPPTRTATATQELGWEAEFVKVRDCGGPTAIFSVANSGDDLESLVLKIVDKDTNDTLYATKTSNAPFMYTSNECPPGGDVLPEGKTFYIGGSIGDESSGHEARATIKLCTLDDAEGTCETQTVDFEIP
jgi:hypothetical protein